MAHLNILIRKNLVVRTHIISSCGFMRAWAKLCFLVDMMSKPRFLWY
jgi:hypothetical protein